MATSDRADVSDLPEGHGQSLAEVPGDLARRPPGA
jgi:hypothetical protein